MILVTGFAPYKQDLNASGELVQSFMNELPAELHINTEALAFEIISVDDTSRETEHQSLEAHLLELLKQYQPDLCIYTGQSACNKIAIERIAINSFMREVIDPSRPAAYWSNLPAAECLKELLEQEAIPAEYSFYAGQHLCNHILYSSQYFAEIYGLSHKSGFIHVPLLPEQVTREHRTSPFMPIEMTRKALALAINHVSAAQSQQLLKTGDAVQS